MELELRPDFEAVRERWSWFWRGEHADRPMMSCVVAPEGSNLLRLHARLAPACCRAIVNYWTCEDLPDWAMQDVIDLRVAVVDTEWFYGR